MDYYYTIRRLHREISHFFPSFYCPFRQSISSLALTLTTKGNSVEFSPFFFAAIVIQRLSIVSHHHVSEMKWKPSRSALIVCDQTANFAGGIVNERVKERQRRPWFSAKFSLADFGYLFSSPHVDIVLFDEHWEHVLAGKNTQKKLQRVV